jgi:hypothetical protein
MNAGPKFRSESGSHARGLAASALLLLSTTAIGFGQSIELRPVADTSLSETVPNNNLGAATFTTAGVTQNNTRTRALYQFDIAGSIPANSLITSAELLLEITRQPADGYAIGTFGLHRVLVPWGEGNKVAANPNFPGQGAPATLGEATWLSSIHGATLWSLPGGAPGVDFVASSSASQVVYSIANSPYSFGLTVQLAGDVQYWLDHPAENFGWMLIDEAESVAFTARRFGSREGGVNAPKLLIQYQPVPEPALLVAGALLLALGRTRMHKP